MNVKEPKKKLLWISHMIPYPPKAGLLNRSYNIIRELSVTYELDLLCLSQKNLVEPYFASYSEGIVESIDALSEFCIDLHVEEKPIKTGPIRKAILTCKSLLSQYPYSIEWLTSKKFKKKIEQQILLNDYDIIYIDTICLIKNINLKKLRGKILLLGHHNIESDMMKRRSNITSNFLMKAIYWMEYKKLLRLERVTTYEVDLNIVCSKDDKASLDLLCNNNKSIVVPNGFDFNLLEGFVRKPAKNRLLFIGTMDWYPNIDAIIYFYDQVWQKLKREIPDIQIDIVGSNPPERITRIQEVEPDFRVHGFVENIRSYLSSASVYICPIRDGGGTKLKLIEAFAHQVPCVANPISCEGIEVSNATHVLHATSPDEYVKQIKGILADEQKGRELATRAFDRIFEKYNYTTIVNEFVNSITDYGQSKCVE